MAKAIYAKYEVEQKARYSNNQEISQMGSALFGRYQAEFTTYKHVFTEDGGFIYSNPTVHTGFTISGKYFDGWYGSDTVGYGVYYGAHTGSTHNYALEIRHGTVCTCSKEMVAIRGSYITDILADYGTLPEDGLHTDGYWYTFIKMASDLKANDTGLWRDIRTGWVNVNGMWKPQSELKANVQGVFK